MCIDDDYLNNFDAQINYIIRYLCDSSSSLSTAWCKFINKVPFSVTKIYLEKSTFIDIIYLILYIWFGPNE